MRLTSSQRTLYVASLHLSNYNASNQMLRQGKYKAKFHRVLQSFFPPFETAFPGVLSYLLMHNQQLCAVQFGSFSLEGACLNCVIEDVENALLPNPCLGLQYVQFIMCRIISRLALIATPGQAQIKE